MVDSGDSCQATRAQTRRAKGEERRGQKESRGDMNEVLTPVACDEARTEQWPEDETQVDRQHGQEDPAVSAVVGRELRQVKGRDERERTVESGKRHQVCDRGRGLEQQAG